MDNRHPSDLDSIYSEPSLARKCQDTVLNIFCKSKILPLTWEIALKGLISAHQEDQNDQRWKNLAQYLKKLTDQITDIEEKLSKLKKIDKVRLFELMEMTLTNFDDDEFNILTGISEDIINKELDEKDLYWLPSIVLKTNPISYRILKKLHQEYGEKEISAKSLFDKQHIPSENLSSKNDWLDYNSPAENPNIHPGEFFALLEMIQLGLIEERHSNTFGLNSKGIIQAIKISSVGKKLLKYLVL